MSRAGRTYWRSLEQIADDPAARAFLEREFPENASELPEGIPRRTLLTLLGASLSLAGLAGCRRPLEKIVPYVKPPEEIVPGLPLRYATSMPLGHSALGLVVESHEGRPTKIEGNELHPSTSGASSVWAQAAILELYDPDRSQTVHHGQEPKSWDEFAAFWKEIEPALVEGGGNGLAVLTEPCSSPTLGRLAAAFRQRFPAARWAVFEPISDENIHAGVELATGQPYQPLHHFDRADVVLSLDADFLLTESEAVRQSRGFARRRRVSSTTDGMSRLWVAEGVLSLTGANADHRLRLPSGQVAALTASLAGELARRGLALRVPADLPAPPAGVEPRWLAALAGDLLEARGRGLILAGRRQPPAVHAAVLGLNAALGNLGRTLTLHELRDAQRSRGQDLRQVVDAMRGGAIHTLVLLGGNPVYCAPADLSFAEALSKVERVVHLGGHLDETARMSHWRLPRTHFLESWGDARAVGGVLGVIQPLIEPLYGGKSAVELLGLLATGSETSGYDLVRATWAELLGEADFERRWSRVLHDGLLAGSELPAIEAQVQPPDLEALVGPRSELPTPQDLEVVFCASPAVFDGRFANNGWLQELPDPVTKMTWDNAALISPATASALGLTNQDLARLTYRGRELVAPVWIVPGQADHVVALPLGYGRTAAGRIGDGRGFDAYALRNAGALDFDRGLNLSATGSRYLLAQTQDHGTMDGRPVVREATLEEFRAEPAFAKEAVEHPPLVPLWQEHRYDEGHQWGMSIDLNACTGCNACVVACQSENNVPIVGKEQVRRGREMHWLRIDRYFTGPGSDVPLDLRQRPEIDLHDPQVVFQPMPCMQCENAPCEQVCPVAATVHDHEGLNVMVYNRCIGTRYCSNNCPYKVRRFNFFNYTKDTPQIMQLANNPDVTVRSRGVMEKCTYCTQRINAARVEAKLAGRKLRDGDVRPACQQACPTEAIAFGDIRDPDHEVSRRKRQERDYVLLAELNNKPRTSYLAKLRNPHPELG